MIITIDGPGGTGKSTLAKCLAQSLGITYFDTGALYRAIAWKMLEDQVELLDEKGVTSLLDNFVFDITDEEGKKQYFVEGQDVTDAIRSEKVTKMASEASTLRSVRDALRPIQVKASKKGDTVFEGRDLGTVVFEKAELKFFLTAPLKVRAERRLKQLQEKFPDKKETFSYKKIYDEIEKRDYVDSSRALAPLKQAEDAILIDTSEQSIEGLVKLMTGYDQERKKR